MKARLLLLLCCAGLCGCQTTGDPTQGGLFGWSQKKADARLAEREETLSETQQTARQEEQHAAALNREVQLNAEDLRDQQTELSRLLADIEALEREAPTPAGASRARAVHRQIDAVRTDESLTAETRWKLLRRYSAEVEILRRQFGGH